MKLRQIVSGVFSGYLTKAVQFLAAISVVPFLLRSSVLGLDGYGSAFTVISFFGFLTLIVDGPRNSFTRSVSQAVGGHPEAQGCTPGAALYAGTRFLFWLCSAITVAMVASYSLVIPLIGLEANSDVLAAYVLAAAIFWVENVLYLYRVPLLARGAVDVVNYCIGFEIIFRSAVFFLYFGLFQASLASYVAITLAFVLARNLAFPIYVHWRWPSDLARSETAPVSLVAGSIRYAGPISLLSMVS
ncbi:MAG TPA: hypothetical protein VKE73_07245, partial [Myxococcota bacterium]|nr:hypothetical protein [Myxococcota bacterium]